MQTSLLQSRRFQLVFIALLIAGRAAGQTDLKIYSGGLTNNFEDRSWAPRSLTNTAPVHSGQFSIRITPNGPWQGLYFYHPSLDTAPYASVSFWANGGTNGGQRLQITALLGPAEPGSSEAYRRFTLGTSNTWEKISIPLSALGVEDKTNLTGLCIQVAPTGTTDSFCVADIALDLKPAPPKPAAAALPPPPQKLNLTWWIAGVLTMIMVLLGWLIFMLRRSGLGKADVLTTTPAPTTSTSTALVRAGDEENWKERALAAEAMASKQAQVLSEKVIPELKEFAKQSLVQGLYSQRNALLETQQKAQLELASLEARLAGLQLPLQERIRAYEQRIGELEKELSARGEEVHELARATLVLMRQKLEEERHREPERSRFN